MKLGQEISQSRDKEKVHPTGYILYTMPGRHMKLLDGLLGVGPAIRVSVQDVQRFQVGWEIQVAYNVPDPKAPLRESLVFRRPSSNKKGFEVRVSMAIISRFALDTRIAPIEETNFHVHPQTYSSKYKPSRRSYV